MNVESWCAVELRTEGFWSRKERKHVKDAMKSQIFPQDINETSGAELDRSNWSVKSMPEELASYKKRKHFTQKCKNYNEYSMMICYRLYTFKVISTVMRLEIAPWTILNHFNFT
jgi:hypothetical protein